MSLLGATQLMHLDAMELQQLLQAGTLTSVQLVLSVLDQIERYDHQGLQLHAMLAVTPKAKLLEDAAQLDQERQQGKMRSPLHGIPITLKDCIATHPDLGLPTSVRSFALLNSRPEKNASIVEKLREAGMIILGKANMGEFCNMKNGQSATNSSPVGGQIRSAYTAKPIDMSKGCGLALMRKAHQEDYLFEFMKAFEKHFPKRPIPIHLADA